MLHNDEILHINLEYKSKDLYNIFNDLSLEMLENIPLKYLDEAKDENKGFSGKTIADLKLFLNNKGIKTFSRTDLVGYPDINNPAIKNITDQLKELDIEPGLITFFKQEAGKDVPLHKDFPYRKNCLLMIPIFYNEYVQSDAITYYKEGGSYNITQPVIMNIMKPHGVKGITKDRLMLHVELPDLTFNELQKKINEKLKRTTFTEWSCESLIPEPYYN